MKLKDEFLDHVYCFMGSGMLTNTYDEAIAKWNAEKCEKVAEDFSKGFAKWCRSGAMSNEFFTKELSLNDLMDIYKQEKEL